MTNVKRAIIVFDDDTTEEYKSFIGVFLDKPNKRVISVMENMSLPEIAVSVGKLQISYQDILKEGDANNDK